MRSFVRETVATFIVGYIALYLDVPMRIALFAGAMFLTGEAVRELSKTDRGIELHRKLRNRLRSAAMAYLVVCLSGAAVAAIYWTFIDRMVSSSEARKRAAASQSLAAPQLSPLDQIQQALDGGAIAIAVLPPLSAGPEDRQARPWATVEVRNYYKPMDNVGIVTVLDRVLTSQRLHINNSNGIKSVIPLIEVGQRAQVGAGILSAGVPVEGEIRIQVDFSIPGVTNRFRVQKPFRLTSDEYKRLRWDGSKAVVSIVEPPRP